MPHRNSHFLCMAQCDEGLLRCGSATKKIQNSELLRARGWGGETSPNERPFRVSVPGDQELYCAYSLQQK